MAGIAEGLKGVLRLFIIAGVVLALFVAVMIAWWLALVVALSFIAISYFRGLLRRRGGGTAGGPVIIEGEYSVEKADEAPPRSIEASERQEKPPEPRG